LTVLTPGRFFLIESDDTDNDDWITDHGGDPDLLDLSTFTLGSEYCYILMPLRWTQMGNTGIVVKPAGGGGSFDEREEKRWYMILAKHV